MNPLRTMGRWARSLGPLTLILALALSACAGCETQENGEPPKNNGANGGTGEENGDAPPVHESAETVARIWLNSFATEEPWPEAKTLEARMRAGAEWVHPDARADFEAGFAKTAEEKQILVVKNVKASKTSEQDGVALVELRFDYTNWLGEEVSGGAWTVKLKQIDSGEWRVLGTE